MADPGESRPPVPLWKGAIGGGVVVAIGLTLFFTFGGGDPTTDGAATTSPVQSEQTTPSTPGAAAVSTTRVGSPPDPPTLPNKLVIDPSAVELDIVFAEVQGLGAEALLASEDGSCAWTKGFVIDISRGVDKPTYDFEPDYFTAAVRIDQYNHVSIAADDEILTGGYSTGSDGRGNSQQWPLDAGSLEVELTDVDLDIGVGGYHTYFFTIIATWTGPSVENYTATEAHGTIIFGCEFRLIDL